MIFGILLPALPSTGQTRGWTGNASSLRYSIEIVLARLIRTEHVYKTLPYPVNLKQGGTKLFGATQPALGFLLEEMEQPSCRSGPHRLIRIV